MLNERKLSQSELDKREEVILQMKKNKKSLVKKYGKDAEKVMYGRATNVAKKKTESNNEKLKEMVKGALSSPPSPSNYSSLTERIFNKIRNKNS